MEILQLVIAFRSGTLRINKYGYKITQQGNN